MKPQDDTDFKRQKRDKPARPKRGRSFVSRVAKIVTGFVMVSLTATEAMMFIIFGRSALPSTEPFTLGAWAGKYELVWREFEFPSAGNRLKGWLISPKNPRALVVLVHGIKSSSDELNPIAQYLVSEDYAVVSFDGTACGRSQGTRTVGLQQQRFDLRALLNYIDSWAFYGDLPLILIGHSAGAYGVASELSRTRAAAAVVVSGFESPLGTMRYWATHYTGPIGNVEYPFLWIREHELKGADADTSATESLTRAGVPVMVVHGSADSVVPEEISIYEYTGGGSAPNITRVYVDTPGHNGHSDILVNESETNFDLLCAISDFLDPIAPRPGALLKGY
ncbi:MAG: alpha/beta fold hydrolase [Clostridia bacterium]|nr:alpha/beta fold hydrolase [Clostridia bacterium]